MHISLTVFVDKICSVWFSAQRCDTEFATTESNCYVISVNDATHFLLLSKTCCLYCLGPVHDRVYGDNNSSVAAFAICV